MIPHAYEVHHRVALYISAVGEFDIEEISDRELLEDVKDHFGKLPSVDMDFVDSIAEYYEKYGKLTTRQREAMVKIARRFRVYQ